METVIRILVVCLLGFIAYKATRPMKKHKPNGGFPYPQERYDNGEEDNDTSDGPDKEDTGEEKV